MRSGHQTPAPKPYEFVDFPERPAVPRERPTGHEQWDPKRRSGRIVVSVEALTPVHVASGLLQPTGNPRQPLVKALLRVGETPVIPGSSVKGCVRSIVEAITASCVRVTRSRDLPREIQGCRDKEHLCLACRLFGAQDFQGLLRFGDLRLIEDPAKAVQIKTVPAFYRPRDREALYVRNGRARGRKFYRHGNRQAEGDGPIQVCIVGSHFEGVIDFVNLTEAQLGLLLIALGQSKDAPLYLKLGGAKPACYGSLQVHVARFERFTPRACYEEWDATGSEALDEQTCIPHADSLLLKPQLEQLADILRWPDDRDCPSGMY